MIGIRGEPVMERRNRATTEWPLLLTSAAWKEEGELKGRRLSQSDRGLHGHS